MEARRAEFERMVTLGRKFGLECYLLDPSEVKKVHPLLDTTEIASALYNPNDGMWYRNQQNFRPSSFLSVTHRSA